MSDLTPTTGPLIGPAPMYPTPWRAAEARGGHRVIVCSEGHYSANVPNSDLAELIVTLVNWFAESGLTLEDLKNSQSNQNKNGVWIPFKDSAPVVW
jgi:hypothetical protein